MQAKACQLRRSMFLTTGTVTLLWAVSWAGCVPIPPPPDDDGEITYPNTTDPTNKGATYIGADACRACHAELSEFQNIHGHGHKLTRVEGGPPSFPEEGARAGVPNPPEGFDWSQISYVIGGYTRKARYIDHDGYILTTGVEGIPTQWNLSFPANGTQPGFANYEPEAVERKPYDFACFQCHTTGAKAQDEDFPEWEENRPGFIGTWEEPGVQCEACHGPGSNHISNTAARDLFVDNSAAACGQCHTRGTDPNVIIAKGGYIQHHEQWPELLGSGAHSTLNCTTCHDPHRSASYDRDNAIRNECAVCHPDVSLTIHEGKVFVRGDYTEELSCESCHMPYVTKSAAAASAAVVGDVGRMGDTKTHIFRIDTSGSDFTQFFSDDGNSVRKDSNGQAAVTLDFVLAGITIWWMLDATSAARASESISGALPIPLWHRKQTGNAAAPDEGRDFQLRFRQVASPTPSNFVEDVTNPQRFNLCGQCHHDRGRTWETTSRPTHPSNQSNVYVGEMPIPDPETQDPLVISRVSVHSFTTEQCATCHMYRQDFQSEEAPAISGHNFTVNNAGCATSGCHPSTDAAIAAQATLQLEVQSRLDDIYERLGDPAIWEYVANGGPAEADQAAVADEIKQTRFLYYYALEDGSLGVHNPDYVRLMLDKAEELLTSVGQ